MSLFDYPRINVKGTFRVNPGTANNDDYAGNLFLPASWGPFAGSTLALLDSKMEEARTYGMSDEDFIAWAQKAQTFDVQGAPGVTRQQIPAEWNYYGGMETAGTASVVGVQTGPGEVYSETADGAALSELIGLELTFNGCMTDINPEGSPPATQFFIDQLTLAKGGKTLLTGQPSKGVGQWINFYRNVNLVADAGAGSYVYHVMKPDTLDLPGFEDPKICGVVFRYYLARALNDDPDQSTAHIEELYAQCQKSCKDCKTNPKTLEVVGTLAPLYEGERILTTPTGRLMIRNTPNVPSPKGSQNNGPGGLVALAPAIVQRQGDTIYADFIGTFPDNFVSRDDNPKYDFGAVSLVVSNAGGSAEIGPVDYADTEGGDQRGWLFELDVAENAAARKILQDDDATFKLVQLAPGYVGTVLEETDYFFVSNQLAVYGEQFGPGNRFLNQGTEEPAAVAVFHRGQELAAGSCPPITLWQYRSTPLQSPGNAEAVATDFAPGQPIDVDTSQPGNFLFTFSINDAANPAPAAYPPQNYSTFMNPPWVTNAPSISLRILPNPEDFSKYYVDPESDEPTGNELLTFEVVYEKALRTYYLLYPAMNCVFPLNSETEVAQNASAILARTETSLWLGSGYMPRTRDLSDSRRRLLRAWCRKVLAAK